MCKSKCDFRFHSNFTQPPSKTLLKFTSNFRLLVSLILEVFVAHLVIVFVIFTVLHLFPWRFHQICRERAARFRDDISYVFPPLVVAPKPIAILIVICSYSKTETIMHRLVDLKSKIWDGKHQPNVHPPLQNSALLVDVWPVTRSGQHLHILSRNVEAGLDSLETCGVEGGRAQQKRGVLVRGPEPPPKLCTVGSKKPPRLGVCHLWHQHYKSNKCFWLCVHIVMYVKLHKLTWASSMAM